MESKRLQVYTQLQVLWEQLAERSIDILGTGDLQRYEQAIDDMAAISAAQKLVISLAINA